MRFNGIFTSAFDKDLKAISKKHPKDVRYIPESIDAILLMILSPLILNSWNASNITDTGLENTELYLISGKQTPLFFWLLTTGAQYMRSCVKGSKDVDL
ncbi:hypothetical protein [Methanolobus psychrotolerans]|nr:hypothetical protein [Methanolobus psychrotolerans]